MVWKGVAHHILFIHIHLLHYKLTRAYVFNVVSFLRHPVAECCGATGFRKLIRRTCR